MICEKCKASIPDTAKFCPRCGSKIEIVKPQQPEEKVTERPPEKPEEILRCPKCGVSYPLIAKFCRNDGTPLEKAPAIEEVVIPELKEEKFEPKAIAEEKPKDVIICPKCGTENPTTAKFCKKDGTPLKEEIKPPIAIEKEIKPEETVRPKIEMTPKVKIKKEEAKRHSKTWIWIAVSGLVLIIAGVGSYLYFSGQLVKKPAEITAIPEVPKTPEPPSALEEVKKPITPQEPETEIVSPPKPAPEPPKHKPSIDIAEVERDLNKTFKDRGLGNVYAKVDRNLVATLKGTVNNPRDKMLASNITESFREIKEVKNEILVTKRTPAPAPTPARPTETPIPAPPPAAPAHPLPPVYEIDPAKLEGDINRALRNAGLRGVTAEVGDDLNVILKGSVESEEEKDRAFRIARTFKDKGVKRIKDMIFVVEQ